MMAKKDVAAKAKYVVKLKFIEPLRATRPPSYVSLVDRHVEAMRGRILKILREKYGKEDDDAIAEEAKKWYQSMLMVFPRKQYQHDGVAYDQIAFPSAWITGFIDDRMKALGLKKGKDVVYQCFLVSPRLIGLRKNGRPVTLDDVRLVEDMGTSNRGEGILRVFEEIEPPLCTENIYLSVYGGASEDEIKKIFEFGRLGATRKKCGAFIGRVQRIE